MKVWKTSHHLPKLCLRGLVWFHNFDRKDKTFSFNMRLDMQ
uniref:Uncharacterized protein n=1 Tax=Anguilla anguilla TaxID=7936 RepID=A0A0E9QCD1_ANGAN